MDLITQEAIEDSICDLQRSVRLFLMDAALRLPEAYRNWFLSSALELLEHIHGEILLREALPDWQPFDYSMWQPARLPPGVTGGQWAQAYQVAWERWCEGWPLQSSRHCAAGRGDISREISADASSGSEVPHE